MHASCLMLKGQVIDKLMVDFGYSALVANFQHEPATIENDTDYYSHFNSYTNSYYTKGVVIEKNQGKIMGRIYGNHVYDTSLGLSYEIPDTLTTKYGDTLKIIPDKFFINNKNNTNPLVNYVGNFFILPDKNSDTLYHLIFWIDSVTSRLKYKTCSYLFYRVDFSISQHAAKLITPYPTYLGFIPDAERQYKSFVNPLPFDRKDHRIRILNSLDKFYFYSFVKDTQLVYSCNLSNIRLEQIGYNKNWIDSVINFYNYNYDNLTAQYFNNFPYILIDEEEYKPDSTATSITKLTMLITDENTHHLKDIYIIDEFIYNRSKDSQSYIHYPIFSENKKYLYILELIYIKSQDASAIVIKKYDLQDTLNHGLKYHIIYNSIIKPPDTLYGKYDNGVYTLTKGPCGRFFVLHNNQNVITINKPDMPFGYEKVYHDFPAIIYPDTNSYNSKYFYIKPYCNFIPLHYNYKLNTTEEYHTNSVILYTDADTAYKTFIWYVWNKQTQQFDSSTGTSCSIPNIGSGIYYKLKSTTAYGYSAWFSDSLYARYTCPKAKFGVEQVKHCQYNTTYFYDSSTTTDYSPGIPHSWHWDFGDGTDTIIYAMAALDIQGKGNITHIYTKSGLFKISLIYYNGVCSDTFTQFQPIYITPATQPGFTVDPMKSCIPQVFHIIPSHQDTIVSEKYYIYRNSNSLQDSFVNTPVSQKPQGFNLNQKDSGVYQIKQYLTGTTGCTTSDSITLQLDNRPILKLVNDTFICSEEVLQLSATSGNYKYLWNTGDTSQSIIINKSGLYSVNVLNGSCMVSDSTNITQDLDERCKLNISVYPNPFGNEFKVVVYSRTTQHINIQLYEMSGKRVASYDNIPVNQFAAFSVNTADLASAMYVLHIYTNEKKFVYKVVKLGN